MLRGPPLSPTRKQNTQLSPVTSGEVDVRLRRLNMHVHRQHVAHNRRLIVIAGHQEELPVRGDLHEPLTRGPMQLWREPVPPEHAFCEDVQRAFGPRSKSFDPLPFRLRGPRLAWLTRAPINHDLTRVCLSVKAPKEYGDVHFCSGFRGCGPEML